MLYDHYPILQIIKEAAMLYRISLEWVALLYKETVKGIILSLLLRDGAKLDVFYEKKAVVVVVVIIYVRHTKFFIHIYLIPIINCCMR